MKLRLKSESNRITIDIEPTATVQELYDQCRQYFIDSNCVLSLNGTDEIIPTDDLHLSSIGLVSGDLIHIIRKDDLCKQLLAMGFGQDAISKVLTSFGATNLNDAIELLSMLGSSHSSSTNQISLDDPPDKIQTVNKSDNTQSKIMSKISTETVEDIPSKCTRESNPLFLQDGITDSFQELLENTPCERDFDYLCLMIHALILETGFKPETPGTSQDDSNTVSSLSSLPDDWRNSESGLYRLKYQHGITKDVSFCLSAIVTGRSLLVSGTLDVEDSDAYQVKLKLSDYVLSEHLHSGNPKDLYSNLSKLSYKIKTITTRVLSELREKIGLTEEILGLTTLPIEVHLRILYLLDVPSICRYAQVARDINRICNDESVWKHVLLRDFRATNPIGTTYRKAVIHMHRLRREERRREEQRMERLRQPRIPLRPDFEIGSDTNNPYGVGSEFPGIIGGYSDLHPSGGFQPGGFPIYPPRPGLLQNPGRVPPRGDLRVPGARFDPYGPVPDDDDFMNGRQPHPDMLRRPRFNPDNGFGGGFGFL